MKEPPPIRWLFRVRFPVRRALLGRFWNIRSGCPPVPFRRRSNESRAVGADSVGRLLPRQFEGAGGGSRVGHDQFVPLQAVVDGLGLLRAHKVHIQL